MNIRLATKKDLPEVTPLAKEVHEFHVANHPSVYKSASISEISNWLQSQIGKESVCFLVAEVENKIVGYSLLAVKNNQEGTFTKSRTYGVLEHICVSGNFRRKGIGSKLLRESIKFAASNGCTQTSLMVWSGNCSAQNSFQAFGFQSMSQTLQLPHGL